MNRLLLFFVLLSAGCAHNGDEKYAAADAALEVSGTELEGSGLCATIAQIPKDCPADISWRNHGQYVSCVSKNLEARIVAGDLTEDQKSVLMPVAAQSEIGKKGAVVTASPDFAAALGAACP